MMARSLAQVCAGLIIAGTSLHASTMVAPPRAVPHSPLPAPRPDMAIRVMADRGFQDWAQAFRIRARAEGISPATVQRVFAVIEYRDDIIALDRNQAEFGKPLWDYLDSAVSPARLAAGQDGLRRHKAVLERIEARYGVEKEVVTAIWGLESAYGGYRGKTPTLAALATLAHDGRRGAFFEDQLIAAMRIVQAGDISPDAMQGSWAGAMGHTQFMPTSYLKHAVDFTGDGRRDIWSDDPTDALASTAAYLAHHGWTKGQPWGVEVRLPPGFDFARSGHDGKQPVDDWTRMGVRGMDGQPVPDHGPAAILLPAGARGPAFMIFSNFNVIETYNGADSYVIAVGHLGDRLRGRGGFVADWPRQEPSLGFAERLELQERLTAAGYSTQGIDGRIGPNTIAAVRAYQIATGMIPDGYPSREVLRRLR